MFNLVTTLMGGILIIIALFWLLHRFSRLNGKAVATAMAFMVIGIVIPYSIIVWPGADVFAIHLAVYLMTVYILGIVAVQGENASARGWHWGPFAIAGFFLLIVGVDSVLITMAQKGMQTGHAYSWLPQPKSGSREVSSRFPGTVSHDYHQKGEQYNAYRRQVEEQNALGWQVSKGWLETPRVDQEGDFKVRILDRHGAPVRAAKVAVRFLRPSDSREDRLLMLQETTPGEYGNAIRLPLVGRWDVVIKIEQADNRYELRANTTVSAH
ncbi:MAG: FixH family protein [Gammaproteobacteria bacterium]